MMAFVRNPTLPLAALLALAVPSLVSAETVMTRRRLGNDTEGMTYDPQRDRAYALDGDDVIAISFDDEDGGRDAPASDVSGVGFRKELDVLALDPRARGSSGGLVWVPPQRRFYVARRPPTELFAVDLAGRPQPTLQLSGLADPGSWASWEGLAWIPPDAPAHGGTIAGLGTRTTDLLSHVFYVRLDGTVEAEIVPQPGTPLERYFCGIQYWPQRPGTLLLSDCGATGVWAMDMQTGALVGDATRPLLAVPEAGDVEGIVVRKNGQIL